MGKLISPVAISSLRQEELKRDEFDCGHLSLNQWLLRRALKNEAEGASRTFVVCEESADKKIVVGYYSLATGCVYHSEANNKVKRNMPDPVPMMLLGRLAVDLRWRGKGLGSGLLKDAVERTVKVATEVGIRGLFVHAINDEAKRFYKYHGFFESSVADLQLMIVLKDAQAIVEEDKKNLSIHT